MYKAGLAVLPDGRLLASPVNMLAQKVASPFPSGCVDLTWPVLPFGVAAVTSGDFGRTWDHEHAFQLAWSNGGCTGWATTRQLPDGALVTIHALEPYDVEPEELGRTVCHSVRWQMPGRTNE